MSPPPVTPNSTSVTSADRAQTKDEPATMDSMLPQELHDTPRDTLTVEQFVQAVWSFDPKTLDDVQCTISEHLLDDYIQQTSIPTRWAPIKAIFDHILEKLPKNLQTMQGSFLVDVGSRDPAVVAPDLVYYENLELCWSRILVSFELRLSQDKVAVAKRKDKLWMLKQLVAKRNSEPVGRPTKFWTQPCEKHRSSLPVPIVLSTANEQTPKTEAGKAQMQTPGEQTQKNAAPPPSKRKRGAEDSLAGPPPKRRCTSAPIPPAMIPLISCSESSSCEDTPPTTHRYQLGSYLQECMANGLRSYTCGAVITDTTVELRYADRMGVVKASKFDFYRKPFYLYLLVAAITSAELKTLGYTPLVQFRNRNSETVVKQHPVDLANSLLVLPCPTDVLNLPVSDPAGGSSLSLQISAEEPRYIQPGLIARGTTILDVKCPEHKLSEWGARKLVVKMGWLVKVQTGEDEFIRVIRRKIPRKWLPNIVDMKASQMISLKDFDLPRNKMENLSLGEPIEERVFRALVLEEYQTLLAVNSVEEFQKVFVDVVRGHYYAYSVAGVLHRDLSDNNIMFRRNVDSDGNPIVIGVLCDWDLAQYEHWDEPSSMESHSLPDQTGHDKHQVPDKKYVRHPTGTGPFIAIELLQQSDVMEPRHVYRYDLESFFYVLVWFCALFQPADHTYRRHAHLDKWEYGTFENMGMRKEYFLLRSSEVDATLAAVSPSYLPLIARWIDPLWELFMENLESCYLERRLRKLPTGPERQTILDEARRFRNEKLTYQAFMGALGEEA